MGMLDSFLALQTGGPRSAPGYAWPVPPPMDPATLADADWSATNGGAEAEAARLAAAEKLRRRGMRAPNDQPLPGAGMLSDLVAGLGKSDQEGGDLPAVDPWADKDKADAAAAARAPKPFGPFPGMMNAPYSMAGGPGSGPLDGKPAAVDLPPSTNDPTAQEPVVFQDGVPLPRPKPDSGLNGQPGDEKPAPFSLAPGDSAALPPNAAPTGPAPPADGGPMSGLGDGLKSVLGKIFDPNHAATWMALGSGFAGAPNIGQGISRASAAAVPAMAADRANEIKQTGISATYRALISRGVPPGEALAAVYNPEVMKATAAKYFETKPSTPHKIGTDMMGNDIMGVFDPNANHGKGGYLDAAGRPLGADGSAAGGVGVPGNGAGILAKGVTDYNSELPAEDYKKQFSPEVQAQMDAYIRGDTMPTGNPRIKGLNSKIKEWAQTYGAKSGVPVSDATFSERRKYRTELGSTSPSTAGGQIKAFDQGIDHALSLSKNLLKLDNSSGLGIPAVADGVNRLRQAFSTKQSGLAAETSAIGQTLAGEVGKLFSGNAGGGVHERELTRDRFKTINSPEQLAGALEGTIETMEGGLHALEARRDNILGPNHNVQILRPETEAKIAQIRQIASMLRGETPAAPQAPAAPLAPGETRSMGGVTIRRMN